jgi:polyferredoxin
VVMVGQRGEISLTVDFVEPFGTTFQLNGTWFAWVILSLFLVGSVFISRVYCRYVCPLGAFFALVAMVVSLAHRAISRTPRTAPHPRSLLDRCPVDAIGHERYYADMGTMNGECIVCSRRTA